MRKSVRFHDIFINKSVFGQDDPQQLQGSVNRSVFSTYQKYNRESAQPLCSHYQRSSTKQIQQYKQQYQSTLKQSNENNQKIHKVIAGETSVAHEPKILTANKNKNKSRGSKQTSRQNSWMKTQKMREIPSKSENIYNKIADIFMSGDPSIYKKQAQQQKRQFRFRTEQLVNYTTRNKSLVYSLQHQQNKLANLDQQNKNLQSELQELNQKSQEKYKKTQRNQKQIESLEEQLQLLMIKQQQELEIIQRDVRMSAQKAQQDRRYWEEKTKLLEAETEEYTRQIKQIELAKTDRHCLIKQNERLTQKIKELQLNLRQIRTKKLFQDNEKKQWQYKARIFNQILGMIQQTKNL